MTQYCVDAPMKVTSPFGWRVHPVTGNRKHHNGVDITATRKTCNIEAFYEGVVIATGYNASGFGNYVILRHNIRGRAYTSLYGHMASVSVKRGQRVKSGDKLGVMGATGMATGKHVHWEVQKGKSHGYSATGAGYLDPMKFTRDLIAWEKAQAAKSVAA